MGKYRERIETGYRLNVPEQNHSTQEESPASETFVIRPLSPDSQRTLHPSLNLPIQRIARGVWERLGEKGVALPALNDENLAAPGNGGKKVGRGAGVGQRKAGRKRANNPRGVNQPTRGR